MGMILSRCSVSYQSYLFDIPLLRIDNDNQLKNWYDDMKYDFKKIVYGSYTTMQLLEENPENILNNFIKEYNIDKLQSKNKSLSTTEGFEYKQDHLLYGDSYDLNVDAWCDYIDRVINKPIK